MLTATDLTVEVRDKNLVRLGQITPKHMNFKISDVFNGVGEWELTLPQEHPMTQHLAQPGSGIVVSFLGKERFSGPTDNPERTTRRDDPQGTYKFTGKSDNVLLADALAFPSPSVADPGAQTAANDTRTSNAETLLRGYTSSNIGGQAPSARRSGMRQYISFSSPNLNRGPTVTKSPRFQNLGELLGEIATLGGLGFRLIQRNNVLQFEVFQPADRSASVRLDVRNGTLTSEVLSMTPPALTRPIVAGQGEGTARTIITRTNTAAQAGEAAWGRPIERFIDQRQTDDLTELQQKGDEALLEEGYTATLVKAIPADNQRMQYGVDWEMGDTISMVTFGQETKTVVTGAVMIAGPSGVLFGAQIGDVREFDAQSAMGKRVEDTERRVDALERSVEIGVPGWSDLPGTIPLDKVPVLTSDKIPTLPLSKIPVLDNSKIPLLEVGKIPTLGLDQIPVLDNSKIPLLDLAKIPVLTNAKIPVLDNTSLPARLRTVNTGNSNADCNTLIESGWYSGQNFVNGPGAGFWWIRVTGHSATSAHQDAVAIGSGNTRGKKMRRSLSAGTWYPWEDVYETQAEIDPLINSRVAALLAPVDVSQASVMTVASGVTVSNFKAVLSGKTLSVSFRATAASFTHGGTIATILAAYRPAAGVENWPVALVASGGSSAAGAGGSAGIRGTNASTETGQLKIFSPGDRTAYEVSFTYVIA